MKEITDEANNVLSDDEIKILTVFKNIPDCKKNEALIKLYILAENSSCKDEA